MNNVKDIIMLTFQYDYRRYNPPHRPNEVPSFQRVFPDITPSHYKFPANRQFKYKNIQ